MTKTMSKRKKYLELVDKYNRSVLRTLRNCDRLYLQYLAIFRQVPDDKLQWWEPIGTKLCFQRRNGKTIGIGIDGWYSFHCRINVPLNPHREKTLDELLFLMQNRMDSWTFVKHQVETYHSKVLNGSLEQLLSNHKPYPKANSYIVV